MILSTMKKALTISALLACMTAMAVPEFSNCGCKQNDKSVALKCDNKKVEGPSWWAWLTNQKSSQFHFLDLVELLHVDDMMHSDKTSLDKAEL